MTSKVKVLNEITGPVRTEGAESAGRRWSISMGPRPPPPHGIGDISVTVISPRPAVIDMIAGKSLCTTGLLLAETCLLPNSPLPIVASSPDGAMECFAGVSIPISIEGGILPPTLVVLPMVLHEPTGKYQCKLTVKQATGPTSMCELSVVGHFTD